MNKILAIATALTICSLNSIGQSMLRVRLTDNTPINVSVDNRFFSKRGTAVTVNDLPYGHHKLKIYETRHTRRGREYDDMIFEGTVKTYEGMVTLFVFDPYKRMMDISEQEIAEFRQFHPGHGDYDRVRARRDEGRNGSKFENTDNGRGVVTNDVMTDAPGAPVASPITADLLSTVDEVKLNSLKKKTAAKKTDTEKMKELIDGLKNDRVTTTQVGDMMEWLLFESSKLDFVKWAYTITVDKEYYNELGNKFAYKSSQEDLKRFLNPKK